MKKVLIGGMVGNALEWYDYALYAQFAPILAMHFFPESDIKEILTFAVFAAGFIVRPLGGIVFGAIGDKLGRKTALVIGIITMAIPTAAIGLLPTYEAIGIAAPILLVITRLMQGFSLGGEFSGCITYIVEYAPLRVRGLAGSAPFISMCIGMLTGSATAYILELFMAQSEIISWGWRLPFLSGFLIGLVGLYMRVRLSESPLYKAAKKNKIVQESPLHTLITKFWRELLIGMGIYLTVTTPFYTMTVFVEIFMQKLGYSSVDSTFIKTMILVIITFVLPISAIVSDQIGRKPVLVVSAVCIALVAYPCFWLLGQMDVNMAIISIGLFSILLGIYMGPIPTVLVELFPTNIRLTGVALSYNISAAIFGGTAPMMGMIFVQFTGDKYAIGYYISIMAVCSLITLKYFKETYRKELSAVK